MFNLSVASQSGNIMKQFAKLYHSEKKSELW